jgi:WD40 repeat protein
MLSKLVPNCPSIPGKTVFSVTSYEALNKRKSQLEQFLRDCVCRKDIINCEAFREFIEIDTHSPEISGFAPVKLSEFEGLPLGIRDFVYLKYEGILFIACSDMNITSRVDAYITNVNLPWEKKIESHITVGAVFVYKVSIDSNGVYYFDKLWAKSFPVQTGVIYWDTESSTLAVGLDNGKINVFKANVESGFTFTSFEEACELKPHSHRVMGISFDHKIGYLYSCSSDKKFIVSEINYQQSVQEIANSTHGFTSLIHDKKNERMFLANEGGAIYVYSISGYEQTLLNMVQTSSKSPIRGLHVDYRKLYIFAASSGGKISVLELGLPGKERFIKEISAFSGNKKMRVVRYNPNTNELIIGDEDGKLTIWSLRKGQPICKDTV